MSACVRVHTERANGCLEGQAFATATHILGLREAQRPLPCLAAKIKPPSKYTPLKCTLFFLSLSGLVQFTHSKVPWLLGEARWP